MEVKYNTLFCCQKLYCFFLPFLLHRDSFPSLPRLALTFNFCLQWLNCLVPKAFSPVKCIVRSLRVCSNSLYSTDYKKEKVNLHCIGLAQLCPCGASAVLQQCVNNTQIRLQSFN